MSLFDFADEETKHDFEIQLPDVGEFPKETLLGFEKEVLGVYISGHPLEEYEEKWRKILVPPRTILSGMKRPEKRKYPIMRK